MRAVFALAALSLLVAVPVHAEDVLEAYSYACKHERELDELAAARWSSDDATVDGLVARRRCFLINESTPVYVIFKEGEKAFFRAKENPGVKLWTLRRNIR